MTSHQTVGFCLVLLATFTSRLVGADEQPPLPDQFSEVVLNVEGMI